MLLWSLTILKIRYENLKKWMLYNVNMYCHFEYTIVLCNLKFIQRDKRLSIFKFVSYPSGIIVWYYTKCFIKKHINQFNLDLIFCNISINKYPWFFKHFTILRNPIHIVVLLTCMYLSPYIIFSSFHLIFVYAQWLNDNLQDMICP